MWRCVLCGGVWYVEPVWRCVLCGDVYYEEALTST